VVPGRRNVRFGSFATGLNRRRPATAIASKAEVIQSISFIRRLLQGVMALPGT
jgi:hypothetical protein